MILDINEQIRIKAAKEEVTKLGKVIEDSGYNFYYIWAAKDESLNYAACFGRGTFDRSMATLIFNSFLDQIRKRLVTPIDDKEWSVAKGQIIADLLTSQSTQTEIKTGEIV
jgi:hypothetical protein